MAFHGYRKKYQMDRKKAEAALQDILAANGQDDVVRRSHFAFRKKGGRHWGLWALAAVLTAALAFAGIIIWQQ